MDKAKRVVEDFTSRAGHHDTTVHENVAPAVERETVKPTQHEEVNTAINKEIHQDHYHRKVQPVHDTQVLPEQHMHKAGKVINREFDNRDSTATERALRAEAGKLRNERTVTGTTHTQSHAPAVQAEQVHHHVHETVQPVVHKETIQPSVVHTTVPIHETHHEQAKIHGTTTLPAVSMDEFKRQGGALGGQSTRTEMFEGCPKGVHMPGCGHPEGSGPQQALGGMRGREGMRSSSSLSSSDEEGMSGTRKTGLRGSSTTTSGTTGISSTSAEKKKPSLIDRLNPMKDSDGDGKRGFMK